MLQCHPKCRMALQLKCKPKNDILFLGWHCSSNVNQKMIFYSFSLFVFSHSHFCLSIYSLSLSLSLSLSFTYRAPPSSLFLSSHISLSHSKLALELGWIGGHGMAISVDRWRLEIVVGCVWISELCGSWVRRWVWSYGSSDGFG